MGIGETLARQRELQGLTVEDIAASTGMSARQVVAIEAGALQFASAAEANRMVRLYARKLGVMVDTDDAGAASDDGSAAVPATPVAIPRFLLKPSAACEDPAEKRGLPAAEKV